MYPRIGLPNEVQELLESQRVVHLYHKFPGYFE